MRKWRERLCGDWAKTSARAFFRYIRNDNKVSNGAFEDPGNGGKLIADPKRIDGLFRREWHDVYNRDASTPKPSFDVFKKQYANYLKPFEDKKDGPLEANDLRAQSKKSKSKAAGLDGWAPT